MMGAVLEFLHNVYLQIALSFLFPHKSGNHTVDLAIGFQPLPNCAIRLAPVGSNSNGKSIPRDLAPGLLPQLPEGGRR